MTDLVLFCDTAGAVAVMPDAEALKVVALESSALIGRVSNSAQNALAVESQQQLKQLANAVEKARKAVKEPFLDKCREIDNKAKLFNAEIDAEYQRLSDLTVQYQRDQAAIVAERESERLAEIARVEAEQRAEQERIAKAAAEVEAKRVAELLRIAAAETQARNDKEKTKLAEQRAKVESEAKEQAAKLEAESARQQELAAQEQLAIGTAPIKSDRAEGQIVKKSYDFEVVDIHRLATHRRDLVKIEPRRMEILDAIKDGSPVPGLRVFEKITTSTRAQKGQKVLDV